MHKCPQCGSEFEGNFCPNCGTQWQDERTCPKCGAKLNGSAKFCNECGYSFVKNEDPSKSKGSFMEKLANVWLWVKKHWKIVLPVGLAIILAIVLSCSIPACIAAQTNGTYYKLNYSGEIDKKNYFTLSSGKWTDDDGNSGTYKKEGEKIIFYSTFFGETEELCDGTLKDYVLSVNGYTYISEKHKHNYSEWETTREVTCVVDGVQTRTCACGIKEKQTIDCVGYHTGEWQVDYDTHWKNCTICGTEFDAGVHEGNNYCTLCSFPLVGTVGLKFTLNSSGDSYAVSGIGTVTDTIIRIPASCNGLPVTSIKNNAFENCSNLISVLIPDSVTNIDDSAFSGCGGLTSITIPDSVTSIGNFVFSGCSSLTSVTIGNSVISIGIYAFSGCSGLTSITIPDSVTSIGDYAFIDCSSLTSVQVLGYTYVGSKAFSNVGGNITFDKYNQAAPSWSSIWNEGFNGTVTYLAEETSQPMYTEGLSFELQSDGTYIVSDYNGSETEVVIPDFYQGLRVTSIGDYAFSG